MSFWSKWPVSLVIAGGINLALLLYNFYLFSIGSAFSGVMIRTALPVLCLIAILGRQNWARRICLSQYILTGIMNTGVVWALGIPHGAMSILKMSLISGSIAALFLTLTIGLWRSTAAKIFPEIEGCVEVAEEVFE